MSISLDVALYLRDNDIKGLTLSNRGLLFTLAFRIGSNSVSWVSQKTLAKEVGINDKNLRNQISSLEKLGLIIVKKSKKDKRKSLYKFPEFLVNYHQKYRSKSPKRLKNNTGRNRTITDEDNGRNRPVINEDTGRNQVINSCSNTSQDIDSNKEFYDKNSCKATNKSKETNKSKAKENSSQKALAFDDPQDFFNCSSRAEATVKAEARRAEAETELCLPTQLAKDKWHDFLKYRESLNAPMSIIAQKMAINVLERLKEEGNDINQVIEQSIVNGWKGLFALKGRTNGPNTKEGSKNGSYKQRELPGSERSEESRKNWLTYWGDVNLYSPKAY